MTGKEQELRLHLDEAEAFIAAAKRALAPESLASEPDHRALRKAIHRTLNEMQTALGMARKMWIDAEFTPPSSRSRGGR